MSRESKQLAFIFVAVIVVGLVVFLAAERKAGEQARTNYESALAACHRNNPKYLAYTEVVEAAAIYSTSPGLRARATEGLREIRSAPNVRHDGTTICGKAVREP
jgi:nitrate/TMAO reductase-like tetraheme cytochrome c subunit